MKQDIILAGVGGQGILSIAAVIGIAAVNSDLFLKQAEVHGMSQRGGSVQSHLRISDRPISSDLIPEGKCDMILSVEPMEALRYLPYLSDEGQVVTSSTPFRNIDDYPQEDRLLEELEKLPNHVIVDADRIASGLRSKRVSNMVVLGAATPYLELSLESLQEALRELFKRKGKKVVDLNISALKTGKAAVES